MTSDEIRQSSRPDMLRLVQRLTEEFRELHAADHVIQQAYRAREDLLVEGVGAAILTETEAATRLRLEVADHGLPGGRLRSQRCAVRTPHLAAFRRSGAEAMTQDREGDVIKAFVSVAGALATGYDIVDLLNTLTAESARLLDVASAGLLLADARGVLRVLAASSEDTRQLELFGLQRDEGPCLDCYRTGEAVSVPDLGETVDRWPQFVAGAQLAGFVSLHALPMRLRDNVLGALGLFGTTVGPLNLEDLALGQALADVASIALVQDKIAADKTLVTEQLQSALNSRVVIEQAKGVLAQLAQLEMAEAFGVLRNYSRDYNLRLTDVAQAVVSRQLPGHVLVDHAATRKPSRSGHG